MIAVILGIVLVCFAVAGAGCAVGAYRDGNVIDLMTWALVGILAELATGIALLLTH